MTPEEQHLIYLGHLRARCRLEGDGPTVDALTAAIAAIQREGQHDTERQIWDSKEQAYKQAIAELQSANVQQGAVIANLLKDAQRMTFTRHPDCEAHYERVFIPADVAQLSADHDAAVRAEERRKVLEAVDAEEELPDDMPDEMWDHIRNDRDAVKESLLIAVQLTKGNIRERIEQLAAQPEEGR